MKKYFAIILCLLIVCLNVSGCSDSAVSGADSSAPEASSEAAVTIGSGEDGSMPLRSAKGRILDVSKAPENYYLRYGSPLGASDYIFVACLNEPGIHLAYIYRRNMTTQEDKLIYEGDFGIHYSTETTVHPNGTYSIRSGDLALFFNSATDELLCKIDDVEGRGYLQVMPDGEHIAYCCKEGVCISNLDFTQTRVICKDEDIIYGPRWLTVSNDGRYLEFTSGYEGEEMRRVLCDLSSGENKFIEIETYGAVFWYDGGFVTYHDGSLGGVAPYIRCFDTDANLIRGFDYDITFNPRAVNNHYFLFCDFYQNMICCDLRNGDMFKLDFGELGACGGTFNGQMVSDSSFICAAYFDYGDGWVLNLYLFEF